MFEGPWQSPGGLLAALGFSSEGGLEFRQGDVRLQIGVDWWTFRAAVAQEGEWLCRPGLWKPGGGARGGQVLDLPVADLARAAPGGEQLSELVQWVVETLSPDWRAGSGDTPPPAPPAAAELTARAGAHTCQGELRAADGHCWIDYRIASVPADLPPERLSWLHALRGATDRFRMVRVAADPRTDTVHARIDLSGAPPLREALLDAALPRLRAAVEALLPVFDLITDTGVRSRALALGGPMNT